MLHRLPDMVVLLQWISLLLPLAQDAGALHEAGDVPARPREAVAGGGHQKRHPTLLLKCGAF